MKTTGMLGGIGDRDLGIPFLDTPQIHVQTVMAAAPSFAPLASPLPFRV
jgi:hypothetical protein